MDNRESEKDFKKRILEVRELILDGKIRESYDFLELKWGLVKHTDDFSEECLFVDSNNVVWSRKVPDQHGKVFYLAPTR